MKCAQNGTKFTNTNYKMSLCSQAAFHSFTAGDKLLDWWWQRQWNTTLLHTFTLTEMKANLYLCFCIYALLICKASIYKAITGQMNCSMRENKGDLMASSSRMLAKCHFDQWQVSGTQLPECQSSPFQQPAERPGSGQHSEAPHWNTKTNTWYQLADLVWLFLIFNRGEYNLIWGKTKPFNFTYLV